MGDLQLFTMEFYIAREKTFSVTVKGWNRIGFNGSDFENPVEQFHWNVYASIYDGHPLFKAPQDAIESLPFHGGCTYDKLITTSKSLGNEYDKSEDCTILKLGSDYTHLHDDYDNHPSPLNGIPSNVEFDAKRLADALLEELGK